jgi:two-component sensor histidine kinase
MWRVPSTGVLIPFQNIFRLKRGPVTLAELALAISMRVMYRYTKGEWLVGGSGNSRPVNWQSRVRPGSAEGYAFATFCIVIATLIRWGLGLVSEDILPLPTYYPAVLFAALIGGAGAGTFAAILGAVIGWCAFMAPHFTFSPLTRGQQISLLTYLFASLLIVWGADHYRRLRQCLEDEEKFRKLTIDELAHRLKNKMATIQSIISFQLRDDAPARDAILSRLTALSATDDLIMATQGQGGYLRDILSAELRPYEVSRVSIEGPDVLLPPKLALVMALLVHELSTNAAKYGALSSSVGNLSIRWSLADARLSLEWRESDGPTVTAPIHSGFGTRLFSRALEQFGGAVEATFATTGLICNLSLVLPESSPSIAPDVTGKPKVFAAD